MTREEWMVEREKVRPEIVQSDYTRNSKSEAVSNMDRLRFLLYNIGSWIWNAALQGEDWAIEALEYGMYDRWEMVKRKRSEEVQFIRRNQYEDI